MRPLLRIVRDRPMSAGLRSRFPTRPSIETAYPVSTRSRSVKSVSEHPDNVIDLPQRKRTPGNPPGPLYRTVRARAGYHIVVSLAPEFDARVYYVSRNEKLHPGGCIVQCDQIYMLPADIVSMFDRYSYAIAFVADDIRFYNRSRTT